MNATVKTRRDKFTEVYQKNAWRGTESVSGTGSDAQQTANLKRALPTLLRELGAKSLVDAPCGDFNWMKDVALGLDYIGVDIVEELVERLGRQYGTASRRFECLDVVQDVLPRADVILCRDCLVHLPLHEVAIAVRNFVKSGATWLLTTTFPSRMENTDVRWSGWRPLNLEMAPLNFPSPQKKVVEGCTEDDGKYADKCLGLWKVCDLRGI